VSQDEQRGCRPRRNLNLHHLSLRNLKLSNLNLSKFNIRHLGFREGHRLRSFFVLSTRGR
jgi:hypothetical protein